MKRNFFKVSVPKEIRVLFTIKLFTTYSFSVLYSSLLLYLLEIEKISQSAALGVVGTFISLNFILHFLGGFWGGTYISNRGLLAGGMIFETIGLLLTKFNLFLGLGIYLTGCGIYVTSITAIMIQRFEPGDDRREYAAFILYSGMNLGFLIGSSISGYLYLHKMYFALFASAAFSSAMSLILALINWEIISDKTTKLVKLSKEKKRTQQNKVLISVMFLTPLIILSLIYNKTLSDVILAVSLLMFFSVFIVAMKQPTKAQRNQVFAFSILLVVGIIFWSIYFIGPMGLVVFIKNHVDSHILGLSVAPQWYNNVNTIMIVLGGPLLAEWFKRRRESGGELSTPILFSLALLLIGIAYIILPLAISVSNNNLVSPLWLVLSYIFLTLGELCVGPIGVAMIGRLAPKGYQGWLLGIWSMNSGIATILSKQFSEVMTVGPLESTVHFSRMFMNVGLGAIGSAIILFGFSPMINGLMKGESFKFNVRTLKA